MMRSSLEVAPKLPKKGFTSLPVVQMHCGLWSGGILICSYLVWRGFFNFSNVIFTKLMPETFKHTRRIEFRDTDMAGIVHFSNFFAYMEQAEHAFLRSVGLGVICTFDGEEVSWPRVNANCNYRQAIRFEEMIDIEVSVARIGTKSITYDFNFSRDETPVADGSITVVCCKFEQGKKPESVVIPQGFIERIQPFVKEG